MFLEGDYKFKDLFKWETYKLMFRELMEMDLDDAFMFLILSLLGFLMFLMVIGFFLGLITLIF